MQRVTNSRSVGSGSASRQPAISHPGAQQRQPIVEASLNEHEGVIEQLDVLLQQLEQRLTQVLAPVHLETQSGAGGQLPQPALPPLAERLAANTHRLRLAGDKVRELIDRLEV